jgi:hypothetical protein
VQDAQALPPKLRAVALLLVGDLVDNVWLRFQAWTPLLIAISAILMDISA